LHFSQTQPSAPASGPTALLLHGFTSSADQDFPAQQWADYLAAHGREVIAIDLPGHGQSPALEPGGYTTSQILASISEAVKNASTDSIDVVAYSLGARLAWDFAAKSPQTRAPHGPRRAFPAGTLRRGRRRGCAGLLRRRACSRRPNHGDDEPDDERSRSRFRFPALPRRGGSQPFTPNATPPQVPTLFLAGDNDPMTQGLEDVAGIVEGSTLERIPGDHMSALQSPQFRDKALAFLGLEGN